MKQIRDAVAYLIVIALSLLFKNRGLK
jgi:hypothetical protein